MEVARREQNAPLNTDLSSNRDHSSVFSGAFCSLRTTSMGHFFISFLSYAILRSKYGSSSWKSIRTIENIFIKKSNFQLSILFSWKIHFYFQNKQQMNGYLYPRKFCILDWLWKIVEKAPFLQSKPLYIFLLSLQASLSIGIEKHWFDCKIVFDW